QIILDENLPQNASDMGRLLQEGLQDLVDTFPILRFTRGKGLLQALVFDQDQPDLAWKFCVKLMELGLLAKPTHGHIVRLAPPLMINGNEVSMALERLNQALRTL
ncbi:MAG: aminotransferase class III-fold pyridoxal phosphate-dependent enzyme, partial [Bacteroidota bacterium]